GGGFRLEADRCALLIQDMQNDVVMEEGAFADSGSPRHCQEQNAIANIARLAERCRALGIPVIHIWFEIDNDGRGLTLNAPLFENALAANALRKGSWGAQPVSGLEPRPGDHVVSKMRMSAWEGTNLETILKAEDRDILIDTGAWTNMSIEHTARTGADKGYIIIVPEDACSTMNADWHRASIDYALQNVAAVTATEEVLGALGSPPAQSPPEAAPGVEQANRAGLRPHAPLGRGGGHLNEDAALQLVEAVVNHGVAGETEFRGGSELDEAV